MTNPPSAAATRFIANHSTADTNLPLLDECPICLDNYQSETCLQITGINGCNHHVGHKCLEEMLRSHPNEEKKCPLCRAVWIPAPALNFPPRDQSLAMSRRMQGMFAGLDGIGDNIAGTPQLGNRLGLQPRREGAAVLSLVPRAHALSPIVIDSDSDEEDYETQFQNFQDSTREIAAIRQRAQDRSRPRGARTGHARVDRLLGRNGLNPFRPTETIAARRERVRDASNQTAPSYASGEQIDARLEQARDEQRRRIAPMRPRRQPGPAYPISDASTDSLSSVPSELLDSSPDTPPRRAFSTHPVANDIHMHNNDDIQELPSIAAQPTRHLDTREAELDRREEAVAAREATLREQETALLGRENRARALVELVTRQRREMEDLGRRHAEEWERAMR
jgi:hypothetical protein